MLKGSYHHLETYWEGGERKLSRKENGDCVYLADGCSIYEERPDECRQFDCRDYIENPLLPERVRQEAKIRWQF